MRRIRILGRYVCPILLYAACSPVELAPYPDEDGSEVGQDAVGDSPSDGELADADVGPDTGTADLIDDPGVDAVEDSQVGDGPGEDVPPGDTAADPDIQDTGIAETTSDPVDEDTGVQDTVVDIEVNPLEDTDGDGIPNGTDPDDDNDGVLDEDDIDPLDPHQCEDADGDTCDDCAIGVDGFGEAADNRPEDDGLDRDGDGLCDEGDTDDDNDGVTDSQDDDSLNPDVCEDSDDDGCDDCAIGTDGFGPLVDRTPDNDGTDTDGDGLCNVGDPDDDNDGVNDGPDTADLDPDECEDADDDGCDDCAVGTDNFGPNSDNRPNNDGADSDGDGICDVGDWCPGLDDADFTQDLNENDVCDEVENLLENPHFDESGDDSCPSWALLAGGQYDCSTDSLVISDISNNGSAVFASQCVSRTLSEPEFSVFSVDYSFPSAPTSGDLVVELTAFTDEFCTAGSQPQASRLVSCCTSGSLLVDLNVAATFRSISVDLGANWTMSSEPSGFPVAYDDAYLLFEAD